MMGHDGVNDGLNSVLGKGNRLTGKKACAN
jgi:hypothetical protein